MYCSHCSHELRPADRFCSHCARPVESSTDQTPKGSAKEWIIASISGFALLVLVSGVAIAGAVGIIAFLASSNQPKGRETNVNGVIYVEYPENTYKPPPAIKQRHLIVNDSFHVDALGYKYFQFTVNVSGKVEGGFRAYGGSEDIEVTLVDEDNFVNWKNRVNGRTPYQSGLTSRGKINVSIPPGIYYLVFSNRHALLTNKTVSAEVYVQEL